jgi:hypothetical protein
MALMIATGVGATGVVHVQAVNPQKKVTAKVFT